VRDSSVGANEKRTLQRTPALRAIASTGVRGTPATMSSPHHTQQLLCKRTNPTWRAPRVALKRPSIQRFVCLGRAFSLEYASCHGHLPPLLLVVRFWPVNCPRFGPSRSAPVFSLCLHSFRRAVYNVCGRLHPPTSGSFVAR